ncbi:TlpA family protein disulfide reductase [bacterium]|nr:TlpA family protein disulfide reductase [bacterium]MBU1024556.1 TlpA family protein disulfide reductase [bacterium]
MFKTKFFLLLIFSVIMISFFASLAFAKDLVRIVDGNKALKGKPAPRFIIETMNGKEWSLQDFKDKKAVVISFWATWCEPCLLELPNLQKFYEKYSDSVEVIAISEDAKNHRKLVENKVKELGLTFPIAMDSEKKLQKKIYFSRQIPYLIMIDKEGNVLKLQQGSPHPEKLIEELEELFGDSIKPNIKTSAEAAAGESAPKEASE